MRFKRIATTIAACAVLTTGIAAPANAAQVSWINPANGDMCTVPEGMTKEEFRETLQKNSNALAEFKNLSALLGQDPSDAEIIKFGKKAKELADLYTQMGCPDSVRAGFIKIMKDQLAGVAKDDKKERMKFRTFFKALGLSDAKAKELTPIEGEDKKDDKGEKGGSSEGKLGSSEGKDKGKDNKDGSSKEDDVTMVLVAIIAVLGLAGLAGFAMTQPPMIPPAA